MAIMEHATLTDPHCTVVPGVNARQHSAEAVEPLRQAQRREAAMAVNARDAKSHRLPLAQCLFGQFLRFDLDPIDQQSRATHVRYCGGNCILER